MDKQTELQQWIKIADTDLSAAQHIAKSIQPPLCEIVCFHCQQAVEKYLKWVLVLHDIDYPKIHDLEELEKLCETISPEFSTIYEKCCLLSSVAVQSRYPSDIKIEDDDMEKSLEYTKSIREFVRSQFPKQFAGEVSHA
jgi:HEPN domain-containing protein